MATPTESSNSSTNPANPDSKYCSGTFIPDAVYDALEQGHINQMQFDILNLFHHWADHKTGRIDSPSAARICRFVRLEPNPANLRMIQKQVKNLKTKGWFSWDAPPSLNYNIRDPRKTVVSDASSILVNQCEIKSYSGSAQANSRLVFSPPNQGTEMKYTACTEDRINP